MSKARCTRTWANFALNDNTNPASILFWARCGSAAVSSHSGVAALISELAGLGAYNS